MERFEAGSTFGNLEIRRELARGSYGTVYLAEDTLIGRPVALKVVRHPGGVMSPGDRERMLNEARLIGRLKTPHVATLYGVHALADDRGWVFEMEFAEGGSLQDLLGSEQRLAADEARRIARGVLSGLKEAHADGIVHGDIKPGNVLLAKDGTVKLVDFGLSRLVGEASLSLKQSIELVGTPLYMAPEVVMGERPTVAADLWSVGVVIYRMLAGKNPFPGRSLPTLFYAIQNSTPARLDPGLPPALTDLAMHCLAKKPSERPHSCQEALGELAPAAAIVAEARPPTPVPPRPAGPRLFGRQAEREQLRTAVREVAEGEGRTVVVSGETGTGKSAIAHEALAYATRLQFRCLEARVTALQGLMRPLINGVRELLSPSTAPDSDRRLVESRLFGTATNLLRDLLAEKAPSRIESRQQILWGLEQLLLSLADPRPLAVCIEDAHLASDEDHRLLMELARRLGPARVVMMIVYDAPDPESSATVETQLVLRAVAEQTKSVHVHLGALAPEAVARLLQERVGDARIAPEIVQHVLQIAEGNPLFTIEFYRHLEASGAIGKDGDVFVPSSLWANVQLPHRLRELVTMRLQGLPEEQRSLLDTAAVEGVEFEGEALAAVLGRPLLDVLRALQQVFRNTGLVIPQARGYRFSNAVLQEGIYEDLAPDLRRAMHRSLAEHLEKEPDVLPERLGLHWERAGVAERASPHLRRAAHEAVKRQELLRAIDHLCRGGLSPEKLDATEAIQNAELLMDVVGAYCTLARYEEAESIMQRLAEGSTSHGGEVLGLEIAVRREDVRFQVRGVEAMDEEILLRAAEELPVNDRKGLAYYLLGMMAKYRGDLERAEQCYKEADKFFVACGAMGMHSSALDQLGSVALRRGHWEAAQTLYTNAAQVSSAAGRVTNAAISEVNRAAACLHGGALDGLAERLQKSIHTLSVEGAEGHVAHAMVHLAQIHYALGDHDGAAQDLDQADAIFQRSEYLYGQLDVHLERSHLAAVTGHLDSARDHLIEAQRLAEKFEDVRTQLEIAILACHIACFLRDRTEAERSAARALEVATGLGDKLVRGDLALGLAEAVAYGLSSVILREAEAVLLNVATEDTARIVAPARISAGARAFVDPAADTWPVEKAASALRGADIGPKRATYRVLSHLFAAEAMRRQGDHSSAAREADEGLRKATELGHVWLEAQLRAFLAKHSDAGLHRPALEGLVRELADRLGSTDERTRLLEAWMPP